MRLSDTGIPEIKDYCGVTDKDSDKILIALRAAAVSFILNQTGLTEDEAEKHEDLSAVLLMLIYDMYMNRTLSVEKSGVNPIVQSILSEYARNLL